MSVTADMKNMEDHLPDDLPPCIPRLIRQKHRYCIMCNNRYGTSTRSAQKSFCPECMSRVSFRLIVRKLIVRRRKYKYIRLINRIIYVKTHQGYDLIKRHIYKYLFY